MEKLSNAIERAKTVVDYSEKDVMVLQEGAKAQSVLPFLESLFDDENSGQWNKFKRRFIGLPLEFKTRKSFKTEFQWAGKFNT